MAFPRDVSACTEIEGPSVQMVVKHTFLSFTNVGEEAEPLMVRSLSDGELSGTARARRSHAPFPLSPKLTQQFKKKMADDVESLDTSPSQLSETGDDDLHEEVSSQSASSKDSWVVDQSVTISDDVVAADVCVHPTLEAPGSEATAMEQRAIQLEAQAREAEKAARLLRAKARGRLCRPKQTVESAGSVSDSLHSTPSNAAAQFVATGVSDVPTPQWMQHHNGGADMQTVHIPLGVASTPVPVALVCVPAIVDEDDYLRWHLRKAAEQGRQMQQQNEARHMLQKSITPVSTRVSELCATENFTTLMFRNLPNRLTRDRFTELLDEEDFGCCYDFAYLPTDFSRNGGLGYAFVNFTSTENAERAMARLQGFTRWDTQTPKVCEVSWSTSIQGLEAHIERYRDSPVMHESVPECFKPIILQGGVRQPFPLPTKMIRPPRVKRGNIRGI